MDKEQPIVRVETSDGRAYYPRFKKNTEEEWELKDKSFRKMLRPHTTSEKPVKKTGKD